MMRRVGVELTLVGEIWVLWDDDAHGIDASGVVHRGAVVRSEIGRPLRESGVRRVSAPAGGLAEALRALRRWSSGADLDALDAVPVVQTGGDFRQRCWQALRSVPAGEVVTYAELASLAGNPRASRAVGTAMATNTLAPFVPCHRVVRSDGVIGNYSAFGGSAAKVTLLMHEGLEVA